jgi:ubiquinone biosynthesis monooxygenase Coq7
MMDDERRHGTRAVQAGGRRLPTPVRIVMRLAAGVMTATAYRI